MKEQNIKEEFISTLSHEIRTPLTSIKGFCQTLINSFDKIDDDKKKQFLNIMLNQSERLIKLTENILNVAKLEDKENKAVFSKLEANQCIQNAIKLTKSNYKDFNFNIEKPKSSLYFLSDKDLSEQIFLNILDNACKYSKNSDNIDIKIFLKQDFVVFSIKNYGVIIEEKDKARIFEKFTRLDSYISTTTQGSGLGLYIVKNLIDKVNGKIDVQCSKENLETEFLIYFPIYEIESATKRKFENV